MGYSIKHNKQFQKFYITIGGREAFLKYERTGEGVIDFKMLYVPKNLRGVGIAEKVLKKAISFIEKNDFKVKSSCSYVNQYIGTHPKLQGLVSSSPVSHTWVLHYN